MSKTCPPMVESPGGNIEGLEADMDMAGWAGPPCINVAECWGCPGTQEHIGGLGHSWWGSCELP